MERTGGIERASKAPKRNRIGSRRRLPSPVWKGEVKHNMGILRMAHLAGSWITARMNLKSERGATAVEYGIMVALIAAVIILAVVFLGQRTSTTFSCSAQAISTKGSVASC